MGGDARTRPEAPLDPARFVVLGVLMACFAWALIIPISLTAPPTALLETGLYAGLALCGGALMLVLWTAVHSRRDRGAAWWRAALLLAVVSVLWAPLHVWSEPDEHPWAWLAGFAIAACALVSWQQGLTSAIVLGAAAATAGAVFDDEIPTSILTLLGCAIVVWAMCQALVWLLRLLRAVQAGEEAQTGLAVAEERLRASRELHDLLGHRLGIIALKAELAADLATRDPLGAVTECDGIRRLATETLLDARRAVHGATVTDLATQLRAAELVLHSAGVEAQIDVDPGACARLSQAQSHLLASAVREAVTNALRHSDARVVSITASAAGPVIELIVVNDGVRERRRNETSGGAGLPALSDRCAAVEARLTIDRSIDHSFELRVTCPLDQGGSR